MGGQSKAVTNAAAKVVTTLQEAVESPGRSANREAAEAIVALRKQFKHEGQPDWAGRSPGYRDMIERLYRQAGVPTDSGSSMQANLRYHLGNALRKVAPPEELQALGMSVSGPLGRVREHRAANPRPPKEPRPGGCVVTNPTALAGLALASVRTLSALEVEDREFEDVLRQVIDESLVLLTSGRS